MLVLPAYGGIEPIAVDDKVWILPDDPITLDVLSNDFPNPESLSIFSVNNEGTLGSLPDVANNTVVTVLDIGVYGFDVAVNPVTNMVYVLSFGDASVTIIDGATNDIVDEVFVGGHPRFLAVNPITNMVYVSDPGDNFVIVIDGATNSVVDTIDLDFRDPWTIDVNPLTNKVYVLYASDTEVIVIDGSTNTVETIVDTMISDVEALAVNPITNKVYLGHDSDDVVLVMDGATNSIIDSIELINEARTLAVNSATNTIYANLGDVGIAVIDGDTNMATDIIDIEDRPLDLAVNEATNTIYATGQFDDNVSVIDGFTNTVLWTISLDAPRLIAADPLTSSVYATTADETLSVLDTITNIAYIPPPDFLGMDSFSYRASDDVNISEPAEVTIMITEELPVGGYLIPIDNTALFLAGLSQSMVWLIPTVLGLAGAGVIIRAKLHN